MPHHTFIIALTYTKRERESERLMRETHFKHKYSEFIAGLVAVLLKKQILSSENTRNRNSVKRAICTAEFTVANITGEGASEQVSVT